MDAWREEGRCCRGGVGFGIEGGSDGKKTISLRLYWAWIVKLVNRFIVAIFCNRLNVFLYNQE